MGKLWCFLALLVALPLLIDSQRDRDDDSHDRDDEYVHPQRYRPEGKWFLVHLCSGLTSRQQVPAP